MFDYYMAPGVRKTLRKAFKTKFHEILRVFYNIQDVPDILSDHLEAEEKEEKLDMYNFSSVGLMFTLDNFKNHPEVFKWVYEKMIEVGIIKEDTTEELDKFLEFLNIILKNSIIETEKATYQAMEAFIHNMNTLNARAGRKYDEGLRK